MQLANFVRQVEAKFEGSLMEQFAVSNLIRPETSGDDIDLLTIGDDQGSACPQDPFLRHPQNTEEVLRERMDEVKTALSNPAALATPVPTPRNTPDPTAGSASESAGGRVPNQIKERNISVSSKANAALHKGSAMINVRASHLIGHMWASFSPESERRSERKRRKGDVYDRR